MGVSDYVIFIIQTLGAVSFALSGSLTAMSKRMDPFGVIVIAITTTFGGAISSSGASRPPSLRTGIVASGRSSARSWRSSSSAPRA